MTKYHPGDKITVRATVAYNCMSPRVIGVKFDMDDDFNGATYVVSTNSIVSHEKVPLRKGDKVKFANNDEIPHIFEVLGISGKYAWITRDEIPFTVLLNKLERV